MQGEFRELQASTEKETYNRVDGLVISHAGSGIDPRCAEIRRSMHRGAEYGVAAQSSVRTGGRVESARVM